MIFLHIQFNPYHFIFELLISKLKVKNCIPLTSQLPEAILSNNAVFQINYKESIRQDFR
jgi:hypothetical protein